MRLTPSGRKFPISECLRKGFIEQGYVLTEDDVGAMLSPGEGFGLVQKIDVGRKVWLKSWGLEMSATPKGSN